jgi:hypothetical protein
MQARYGLDRRPVGRWVGVGAIVLVFAAILLFVARGLTASNEVKTRLIQWDAVGPDRVNVTFQTSRDPDKDTICVVRAQDSRRIDVGYATVTIPAGNADAAVIIDYALRTLAPAYTAELLGCEVGGTPRVPPPQFPPGVVPPTQPYTAAQ